ncbi:MAG: hypothetical protein ACR2P2_02070 [Nakamurella sp.]
MKRWLRRVLAIALVVAALSLASWLNTIQAGADTFHRIAVEKRLAPFEVAGRLGNPATARTFVVTARAVDGSQQVAVVSAGELLTVKSTAVFVVVTADVQAVTTPVQVQGFQLRDGTGRIFDASVRWSQSFADEVFDPRLPQRVSVVFEVPTDVTSLELLVSPSDLEQRLDSQAVIPLNVGGADIDSWKASTAPLRVAEPRALAAVAGPR